ncbi:helix-turn-helix domain-containing protein [Burkholderia ubonensis]|uniref:helix-turn-helix domain-containing protein n=1 Tax=Burkholderia ubonensis TaxID=101571 RepID=UPI0009B39D2C
MKKSYSHLSAEERAVIMIESGKKVSVRAIARLLGRSASTVTRELARNRARDVAHMSVFRASSRHRRQGLLADDSLAAPNGAYPRKAGRIGG